MFHMRPPVIPLNRNAYTLGLVTVIAMLVAMGCTPRAVETTPQSAPAVDSSPPTSSSPAGTAALGDSEHGHLPGAHGGTVVPLGRDSYHVEAVIDSSGAVHLYTLGKDESRVIDVETQTLKGFVKADDDADWQALVFEASPQEGDRPGKTSLFVGQLTPELIGRKLDVTVPNMRIDGERFRLGFQSGHTGHAESSDMPAKVSNDAERALYLTPGGRYTDADITANGRVTASAKFKGIKSEHNMKPAIGDRLCPISGTKANSKFTWIIDGRSYAFCCPPCIDEFLSSAKSSTDPLPDPESFIKK